MATQTLITEKNASERSIDLCWMGIAVLAANIYISWQHRSKVNDGKQSALHIDTGYTTKVTVEAAQLCQPNCSYTRASGQGQKKCFVKHFTKLSSVDYVMQMQS